MRYTYSVNFHYPTGPLGWGVAFYQKLKGVKHWHFSHVSISYEISTGNYTFSRELGQTLIGVRKDPTNCVILLVKSDSLDELLLRAYLYRHQEKESWRGDCVVFAQFLLYGYTKHHTKLPGELYQCLFPDMMRELNELSNRTENARTNGVEPPCADTNPEWSDNEGDKFRNM